MNKDTQVSEKNTHKQFQIAVSVLTSQHRAALPPQFPAQDGRVGLMSSTQTEASGADKEVLPDDAALRLLA